MDTTITGDAEPSYASTVFARGTSSPAVAVADGHGVKISVRRGHLVIEDGLGDVKRTRRIPRVPRELARLVILSQDGFITLDAVHWCAAQGIGIYQYDRDGRCLITSPGQGGDSRLIRVQALADFHGPHARMGLRIVNRFIAAKVQAQADCIRDVFRDEKTAAVIEQHSSAIHDNEEHVSTIGHEGHAARYYWKTWRNQVHMPFPPEVLADLPVHWYGFNGRASGHNIRSDHSPNRNATDPVNAMLNYAYSVLESEAVHACNIMGLNPDLGMTHGDVLGRHGMALDLMETARPVADRAVLFMLDCGSGIPYANGRPAYIKPLWFCESGTGVCRLVAPLTHMIAEQVIPAVAPVLAKHAEICARELGQISHSQIQPRKPLTLDRRLQATISPGMSADLTAVDIVPDVMWESVRSLIPPEPVSRTYKPVPRADSRAALAGVICHELYGTPWSRIPLGLGVDRKTCRRRLDEWKGAGVWDVMLAEILRSGKRVQLIA